MESLNLKPGKICRLDKLVSTHYYFPAMKKQRTTQNRMSSAERQRQLLEVALNAFSRRGYKGTTTKQIAAAAGVTEAVIFQHFPSKKDLYSAVLELHLDAGEEQKWMIEISECMERNDDEALVLSLVRRILGGYRRNTLIERVILFAALEGHEQGLTRMRAKYEPVFEKFMDYIARRQRAGAFVDGNPYAIMIALGGIAHQYGLISHIFRAPFSLHASDGEMAQMFAGILLNGIRKNRSGKSKGRKYPKHPQKRIRKAS
jgi:TetR/AcrR family transcriptional regulator